MFCISTKHKLLRWVNSAFTFSQISAVIQQKVSYLHEYARIKSLEDPYMTHNGVYLLLKNQEFILKGSYSAPIRANFLYEADNRVGGIRGTTPIVKCRLSGWILYIYLILKVKKISTAAVEMKFIYKAKYASNALQLDIWGKHNQIKV